MSEGTVTKPGYKTTEFWLTMVVNAVSAAAIFGIVTPEESEATKGNIQEIVAAATALLTNMAYIWSRAKVKS